MAVLFFPLDKAGMFLGGSPAGEDRDAPQSRVTRNASVDDFKRVMANKTDEELYHLLHGHPDQYTERALEAAKREFDSRTLTAPALIHLSASVASQKKAEDAPLEWPFRILAFFVSTVFLGVPVLLAHRHYVENGNRRKAREWGRWAIFGFLFYFVLSVLRFMMPLLSN